MKGCEPLCLGLDIGSTTAKVVVRQGESVLYERYERHFSMVRQKAAELLEQARFVVGDAPVFLAISGSAGLGLSEVVGVPFVQEVYATSEVVRRLEPDTSCVIELGGEDAKIIFFDGGVEERMNGSCAGGTGAFIDQMATLLNVTADELDELSLHYTRIYPIASRCGVFAKTDIQPLLNQGARKEDVAASIYQAVVNQTVAGLAQGRKIRGKVLFLGGPLYYCKGLRQRFAETLGLSAENAVYAEYARFSVALGASLYAEKTGKTESLTEVIDRVRACRTDLSASTRLPALFDSPEDLASFRARHGKNTVQTADLSSYTGNVWIGIDCGSTTTKLAVIGEDNTLLYTYYASNRGNPVQIVREQLIEIYRLCGDRVTVCGSAVTGYGEDLIRNGFGVDYGIVETVAHYTAAKYFRPNVDFILDIGGQDIKCFRIRDGAIDSILLNEACSSGCGSFLETFARAMGYTIAEFAEKGLSAKAPVNLGSRCTVFMNSSVKQSQKDGASVEDISAGLAVSVVKNAIYKVIRAASACELGENIVVQGGTFHNDGVLRAFERELGHEVIRPSIAGLMGAFGAALYAKRAGHSTLLSAEELECFVHTSKSVLCQGCTNHCHLTINDFGSKKRFVSGNQCEKGASLKSEGALPNLHEFKRNYLTSLPTGENRRGRIGLPMALGMYELLPLWNGIFTALGFETVLSPLSTRQIYEKGQFSIPSDTACYPAKIMHGHIAWLLEQGVDGIFYPCLTYNVDEKAGDNHYNCPVVAYYSELLNGNVEELSGTKFLYPYLNINSPRQLTKELQKYLSQFFGPIPRGEVRRAVKEGFAAYDAYMAAVRAEGEKSLAFARREGKRIMILAGRPYHIDPEIGHGIDKLATSLGFVVVSEDSICHLVAPQRVRVLNQWTYHARLYRAARYAAEHADTQLVQLVSFGCGVDAITTDEVREILEGAGKYYTQLKIDEITNLGAVRIRLRSLLGALEEREEKR
ncbi:MAG: 2-hydroxyacyl-CoA dehydratase [Clostridia bacterium]|nr:2-hydroxyacyl-CoA dehydratase [Clostridia bacterium]